MQRLKLQFNENQRQWLSLSMVYKYILRHIVQATIVNVFMAGYHFGARVQGNRFVTTASSVINLLYTESKFTCAHQVLSKLCKQSRSEIQ